MDVTGRFEGFATEFGVDNAIQPIVGGVFDDFRKNDLIPTTTIRELDEASWLLS
jgi:hypothetical protein